MQYSIENPNAGHRSRLRERFLGEGLDAFEPHEVLELVLFYAQPRCNTNEIGHLLINKFGSVKNVLSASVDELCSVAGVGENAAMLFSLLGALGIFYKRPDLELRITDDFKTLTSKLSSMYDSSEQPLMILCPLDENGIPVQMITLAKGNFNISHTISNNVNKIAKAVINSGCRQTVISYSAKEKNLCKFAEAYGSFIILEKTLRSVGVAVHKPLVYVGGEFLYFKQPNRETTRGIV